MEKNPIHRRNFIKLLALAPFILADWPLADWPASSSTGFSSLFNHSHPRPNILILVFDAFSATNCSLYGYPRNTTPNLERFARQATVFHRHYAGGNFTSPGTASLLTGTYPWTHHAYQLLGSVNTASTPSNLFSPLAQLYHTFSYTHNPLAFVLLNQFRDSIRQLIPISELCLANDSSVDRLFAADYSLGLEAENLLFRNITYPSGSLFLSPLDNLKRLYLRYSFKKPFRERFPREISRFSLESPPAFMYFTLEDAIDWLQQQIDDAPRPFMGYVHLFPPHHPYATRREFIDQFKDGWEPTRKPAHFFSEGYSQESLNAERRLYDETIAYVDAEFGRLFDAMQKANMLDNTFLLVTSDHGEMFERGILTHNTPTLYEPIIRVPLLVSSPGQSLRRDVYTPTSNVDLLPTLCQIVGLPIPEQCEGLPLPLSDSSNIQADRPVYVVEAKENPKNAPLRKATIAMIKAQHKLIYTFGYSGYPDTFELYDLDKDPDELDNLYNASDPVSIAMRDELLAKITAVNQR